ncbi:thiopurine S-methyltransferase [Trypanosoma rangeli]|uniref:Thiopurine S-methyltransferase n=1 Tax=Trypanosoma rangeli TaxID=5698 RepID=A0A3R7NTY4_TRYRA|nr:thiopurine S-methyltransferase [Trypanosoma rangeli]RNF07642.1 thiopurine S-methyltransferase [Trypanosoma rangeli]|eukprot:RNF07642.1 thiopurine S-methyltransferase [Trypanosoma rangeli]
MHLASHNVKEFWNTAWATQKTGWKEWERLASFTHVLSAFLRCAGLLPAEEQTEEGSQKGDLHEAVIRFLEGKTVFVPLCGDSTILPYIVSCRARHVIGVDLSDEALTRQRQVNFPDLIFKTTKLDSAKGSTGKVEMHEVTTGDCRITLFYGDLMELPLFKEYSETAVDFVFDRAAMMAIPPDLRSVYVKTVTSVLRPSAGVAYERMVRKIPQQRDWGPPFMVAMDEVLQMFRQYTGRDYKATLTMTHELEDNFRSEWYAILPQR